MAREECTSFFKNLQVLVLRREKAFSETEKTKSVPERTIHEEIVQIISVR
jgi:hypothetical protein